MDEVIYLDQNYSTTRRLTKEKPQIINADEDKLEMILFLPIGEGRQGEGGLRTKGYFKKSDENKPLISIVTVVYNGEKYLEQTIQSVITQGYDNVEYIIIDGGSTDRTLEIIKKYAHAIDYWVSEKDKGIYDAMNKGLSLSAGEYLGFLNADDWYNENSIETIVQNTKEKKPIYIFGDMNMYDGDRLVGVRKAKIERYKKHTPIGHQSLFVKTDYLRQNPFDLEYLIISDYDLMIKLIKSNASYIQINEVLSNFRVCGISSTTSYDKERFKIQYRHFGLLHALYGFILETNIPFISHIVKILIKIKHWLNKGETK